MLIKTISQLPGVFIIFTVGICFASDDYNAEGISELKQSVEPVTEKSTEPVKVKTTAPVKTSDSLSIKEKHDLAIKEKWGVEKFSVHQTSAGYMLDIRYLVTDAIKAKPLFDRKLRPFVIEEASGIRYGVPASPKVGYLRQAPSYIKEDKVYFLFVASPGKKIKKGDKLTLVIGDFRVEHLTVE